MYLKLYESEDIFDSSANVYLSYFKDILNEEVLYNTWCELDQDTMSLNT